MISFIVSMMFLGVAIFLIFNSFKLSTFWAVSSYLVTAMMIFIFQNMFSVVDLMILGYSFTYDSLSFRLIILSF
jgi:hypothetical protein